MTTIYLMRHSESFRVHEGNINSHDSVQIINEKNPLSVAGEKLASRVARLDEFQDLDAVFSSSYVRAMATAKYFAYNNNLKVNIDDRFNERLQGINSWSELPSNFDYLQFKDETYKLGYGENRLEVKKRMHEALLEVLRLYSNKKILIVSHFAAITSLLSLWCEINYNGPYKFMNDEFFTGQWKFCTCFKLIFDNDKLIDIKEISIL